MHPRIAARKQSHDGKKARRLKKTIARSHPLHPPLFVAPHFVQYLRHRIIPPVHPINFIDRNVRCVPPLHQFFDSIPKHLTTRERKLIRSPFMLGEFLRRLPVTQSLLPLPPQHPQIPRAFRQTHPPRLNTNSRSFSHCTTAHSRYQRNTFHVGIQRVDVPPLVTKQGVHLVPHIPHNLL